MPSTGVIISSISHPMVKPSHKHTVGNEGAMSQTDVLQTFKAAALVPQRGHFRGGTVTTDWGHITGSDLE